MCIHISVRYWREDTGSAGEANLHCLLGKIEKGRRHDLQGRDTKYFQGPKIELMRAGYQMGARPWISREALLQRNKRGGGFKSTELCLSMSLDSAF